MALVEGNHGRKTTSQNIDFYQFRVSFSLLISYSDLIRFHFRRKSTFFAHTSIFMALVEGPGGQKTTFENTSLDQFGKSPMS